MVDMSKQHPADEFITTRPVFHSAVDKGIRLNAPGVASGLFSSRAAARAAYTKALKAKTASKMTYHVQVHFATANAARCVATVNDRDAALRAAREYTSDAKAVWISIVGHGGVATEWVKQYAGIDGGLS